MNEGYIVKGIQSGIYKEWFRDGTLKLIGIYKAGYRDSIWNDYYINGKLKSQSIYHLDSMKMLNCPYQSW